MLERRKFLRSGGILGFLAMGATAAPVVIEKIKEVPVPDGELYLNINGQWKKVLTA